MNHLTNQVGSTFCIEFPAKGAYVNVRRVTETPSGDYRGWVELFNGDVRLHGSALNLCLASARQGVVKSLNGKSGGLPWSDMLDTACNDVVAKLQAGAPVQTIRSSDAVAPEQFLVAPFLPTHEPTIVFGKGGSCKSYVALLLGIAAQLSWKNNPLAWTAPPKPVRTLYLDWETSRDVVHRRVKRLVKGMGLPELDICYRECRGSLSTEVDAVAGLVLKHEIGLVIVDSAGRAVGDDLNAPGPVNGFYSALRQLGATSLIVHHCAKNGFTKEKTPFGSQYFEANARSAWLIEREREGNDTDFALSLANTKVNDSPKHGNLGLRIHFDNTLGQESTRFELADLKQTEFCNRVPLKERMIDLLRHHGRLPVAAMAEELGESPVTIRARANGDKSTFVKVGEEWALKSNVQ